MDVALRLFGRCDVHHDGRHELLRAERRCQLLAYLALRRTWVSRDQLAALFWPEHANAAARRNLRKVLHDAQALSWARGLEVQGDNLRWLVATDVQSFEQALAEGRPDAALQLCRGPLCEGLDDPDCPVYTEWLNFERTRLADRRRSAALHQLDNLAPEPALALASALLDDEPLDEELVAAQLRALLRLGRRHEAQRAYRDFAEELAESLGTEPSADLRRLGERIEQEAGFAAAAAPPTPAVDAAHSFIGRMAELQELPALLLHENCRLLVVTGPGGIGKSRLTKAALPSLEPHFAGGIGWIPLDDLSDVAQVPPRIAQLLDIPLAGADSAAERVIEHLHDRAALLVLDNIEHLDGLPVLMAQLLERTPVKLLATSRHRPGVSGEWLLPLAGLAGPARDDDPRAGDCESVRLFVTRAQAAQSRFDADPHLPKIAALARALGGMPLAIELAAHWVRLLPVSEIVDELCGSIELLARDDDGEERPEHRSVRATFEQSWRMLAPPEAQALAAMSVFAGSFPLRAARAVAAASVPLLAGLVDKSLLRAEQAGERSRFSLHPLLRQFAAERLGRDAGAERDTRARHAAFYGRWLALQEEDLRGPDQRLVLAALDLELPDCSAAWHWAVAETDTEFITGSAIALMYYFEAKGLRKEGLALFRAAQQSLADGDPARGAALATLAQAMSTLSYRAGDLAAVDQQAARGIDLARRHGVRRALKGCLLNLGLAQWQRGEWDAARRQFSEALQLARVDDDEHGIGVFVSALAMVDHDLGNYAQAEGHYREALAIARRRNDSRQLITTLNNLGQLLVMAGRPSDALPVLEEGLARCREAGVDVMQSQFLLNLGDACAALDRDDEALCFARQALSGVRRLGEPQAEVESLTLLSRLELRRGELAAAHRSAHEALQLAIDIDAAPLQAICVHALAGVLAAQGLDRRAAELWRRVVDHSATPAAVRAQAEQQLATMRTAEPGRHATSLGEAGELLTIAHRLVREHPPAADPATR